MLDIRINRRSLTLSAALALATAKGVSTSGGQEEADTFTFAVLGLLDDLGDGLHSSYAILLTRIDFENRTVRTLNIPRTLYVELPGVGYDTISHAYRHGLEADPELERESGAELTLDTINHNFGVTTDAVAVFDIEGAAEVIDAVGGIEIDNPVAFSADGFDYPAGPITLSGDEIINYVRGQSHDSDGDRLMRRQLVLDAAVEKLQEPEVIALIPEIGQRWSDVFDTDMTAAEQLQLATTIPMVQEEDRALTNIDEFLWADTAPDGTPIQQADWTTLPEYVQSWLDGEID